MCVCAVVRVVCVCACMHMVVCFFFCIAPIQEKLESSPKRDVEGMGVGEIKYGDSICFVMHAATGLWLSYQAPDAKSARLGPLKRRVMILPTLSCHCGSMTSINETIKKMFSVDCLSG